MSLTDIKSHRAQRAERPDTKVCVGVRARACVCLYCGGFHVSSLCHESKKIKGGCVNECMFACVKGDSVRIISESTVRVCACVYNCVATTCQTAMNQQGEVWVALPLITQCLPLSLHNFLPISTSSSLISSCSFCFLLSLLFSHVSPFVCLFNPSKVS